MFSIMVTIFFKLIFTWKCIKIIFYLFILNLFFNIEYQNYLKTQKQINLKQKN